MNTSEETRVAGANGALFDHMPGAREPRPDGTGKSRRDRKGRQDPGVKDLGARSKGAEKGADKAAENLYRILHTKHDQLSSLADNKAHIMLTICVGVVGVSASQLFDPQLQYAALTLIVTSIIAAGLAVYTTMPSLTRHTDVDHTDPTFNLIFFADFSRLPLNVYQEEMAALEKDRERIYRALARDVYYLGKVLNEKKFRYLAYCYWVFFSGLVGSVVVLLVTFAAGWL